MADAPKPELTTVTCSAGAPRSHPHTHTHIHTNGQYSSAESGIPDLTYLQSTNDVTASNDALTTKSGRKP